MILYPGNSIFNISIDGFLRCLQEMKGYEFVLSCLSDDGTLTISNDDILNIFPSNVNMWELTDAYTKLSNAQFKEPKESPVYVLRSLFLSNSVKYPNLMQHTEKNFICAFQNYFSVWSVPTPNTGLNCSFCGEKFSPDPVIANNSLTAEYARDVASFPKSFPNSFWNANPQTYICPRCKSLFLFQHLSSFENNHFFINTNSFRLNYILNTVITQNSRTDITSALQRTLKNIKNIGMWSMSNIEVVQKDYYKGLISKTFPKRIAETIIKPNTLFHMKKTSRNRTVGNYHIESSLDLITRGSYSGLLQNAYKCIKIEEKSISRLAGNYCALFLEINGGEVKMGNNLTMLRKNIENEIKSSVQKSISSMKFKLVEQIRVNNRTEVIGILTRIFLSHNEMIPDFLIYIFNEEDDERFQAKMYVFLGSLEVTKKEERGE